MANLAKYIFWQVNFSLPSSMTVPWTTNIHSTNFLWHEILREIHTILETQRYFTKLRYFFWKISYLSFSDHYSKVIREI